MPDEIIIGDPPPAKEPEPKPSEDIQKVARKNAEYFARNPEVLDETLKQLEQAGVVHANQRIDQLERELAVTKAIAAHGLTESDEEFITGRTKDEITASAAKFKARLDAVAPKTDTGTPAKPAPAPAKPAVKPAAPEVPELPAHRGGMTSLQQAEAELLESSQEFCANFNLESLGRS